MRKQGTLCVSIDTQVAFHDVDIAQIVWHGHYLKYLENARWALMDDIGFGLNAMMMSGYAWPIIELQVKYVHSARFGDHLRVRASLVEWQNRLAINYLVTHAEDGKRVARARTIQVAVEAHGGTLQFTTPAMLTDQINHKLEGRKSPMQAGASA